MCLYSNYVFESKLFSIYFIVLTYRHNAMLTLTQTHEYHLFTRHMRRVNKWHFYPLPYLKGFFRMSFESYLLFKFSILRINNKVFEINYHWIYVFSVSRSIWYYHCSGKCLKIFFRFMLCKTPIDSNWFVNLNIFMFIVLSLGWYIFKSIWRCLCLIKTIRRYKGRHGSCSIDRWEDSIELRHI